MDQLKSALLDKLGAAALPEGKTRPEAPAGPKLPDPLSSEWGRMLRDFGVEIPKDPTLGQLTQRSDARTRELTAQGRKRDANELKSAKEKYLREREREAWSLVKARFEELALPEKAYRALKQEEGDPEKVLTRLRGARGEELRGAGATRVRDALLDPK